MATITMTDTTTILTSAIVALAGVIGVGGKMLLKVLRENTRALDRANDTLNRVEELLKNWRAR